MIRAEFGPTLTSSEPPIRAADCEIRLAVCVAVPSRIQLPMSSPSQTSLAPSFAFPPRTARSKLTLGIVPYGTRVTFIPLSSVNFVGVGMEKSFGAPGAGGVCFWPSAAAA